MNTFLLHCYFEWNVHFTCANNLGVLDFLVCASVDWQSHSSFRNSKTNSAASVALESNLNRSIHFSHIVINARSILSLKLRYILFLKDEALRTKQICIHYSVWPDTRSDYGFRCACVFIWIHKYRASSQHQLIRRLNNLNRFIAGCSFRLLFV